MTHSVVSGPVIRLLAGMGLGAVKARIAVMVVLVGALRFTLLTSASVPVLTDQRSTPHCANSDEGTTRSSTTKNKRLWRGFISSLHVRLGSHLRAAIIVAARRKEIQQFVKFRGCISQNGTCASASGSFTSHCESRVFAGARSIRVESLRRRINFGAVSNVSSPASAM